MKMTPNRAIVIGGSIAGLLAARVLSDHFDYVTVIERDKLPQNADHRKGVPQSNHLHTLLVKGQQIMENLFPSFTAEMTAAGAPLARWGQDGLFVTTGGRTQFFETDITTNILTRVSLEWLVRRRVMELPNVSFQTEYDVTGLIASGERVTGVQVKSRTHHTGETVYADLVVDASGRRSHTPEWLQNLGYDTPTETIINAHTAYATRWFEVPADTELKLKVIAIQPRPAEGCYRGGGLLQTEGNRWVVTMIGANGDYPPTDEAGWLEFARSLPDPLIYNAVKNATPISPIYGYRNLENQRRHYDKLKRQPDNFVVIGDSFCALNPFYGQGMTTAALQAIELDQTLRQHNNRDFAGLPARFYKRLAGIIEPAWLMATSEDMRYPGVEGQKPDIFTRMVHRYFDLFAKAMPHDIHVTYSFFEAMNLLKSPIATMMHPAIVLRVLRQTWLRRADKPPATSTGVFKTANL